MNFVEKFIEDLGYREYAYTGLVDLYTDKIGYYHLKIQNYDFRKVDICLKTKELDFSPIVGRKISSEDVEFLEALRNADTTKLCEDIDKWKGVLYDATKQKAYDDAKKEFSGVKWDEYKKGKVLVPFTYELYGDGVYDIVYDMTGEDLLGVLGISDDLKAKCEGVLKYWEEMTGREDLYVYDDDKYGGYICSKNK
jgi:hypothetical protein